MDYIQQINATRWSPFGSLTNSIEQKFMWTKPGWEKQMNNMKMNLFQGNNSELNTKKAINKNN